ncbi:hypothetical protein AMELA_G00167710 [Ameiurus melas]|uniref:ribonuclease H n=1 Tax=Ameiurus melas TaxID=219545 RepID=A0A7J6ABA2_AMEME|nr:hypothetical protein AMELA_G00167710 [Ameiurus melas]
MDILLRPHNFAAAYLADVVIHSSTWSDHLFHLGEVLKGLQKAGLTANPKKCHLRLTEAQYLGYRIEQGLLKPQAKNIEAVKDYPRPMTKKQIRAFLGLAGYYRRFVPNFSAIAAPLSDLTKKGQPDWMKWSAEAEAAFQALKEALTSVPVPRNLDFTLPFTVHADASETALGAVLSQTFEGEEHPVLYISRKLSPQKKIYHHRTGSPSDKMGHQGAAVLPGWPTVHPGNRPRPPKVDGQGKRYERQGNPLVSRTAGLLIPGPTLGGGPTWERGLHLTARHPLGPPPSGSRLGAEGGYCCTGRMTGKTLLLLTAAPARSGQLCTGPHTHRKGRHGRVEPTEPPCPVIGGSDGRISPLRHQKKTIKGHTDIVRDQTKPAALEQMRARKDGAGIPDRARECHYLSPASAGCLIHIHFTMPQKKNILKAISWLDLEAVVRLHWTQTGNMAST